MNYINEISFYLNDRSEDSNKRLAARIVNENIEDAVTELVNYLFDKNKTIASDCIAVLYHVGYEKPEMIVNFSEVFCTLLSNKNNRMVWGGMIALATISEIAPDVIESYIEEILRIFREGSLISQVWAYKTITTISKDSNYYNKYIDFLLDVLESTRPIDFTKRATIVNEIIQDKDRDRFTNILSIRKGLSKSATKVVEKLIKDQTKTF